MNEYEVACGYYRTEVQDVISLYDYKEGNRHLMVSKNVTREGVPLVTIEAPPMHGDNTIEPFTLTLTWDVAELVVKSMNRIINGDYNPGNRFGHVEVHKPMGAGDEHQTMG